ncbi:MAG: ATP-binding protein [Candidatus Daviesbacteria bacterium]|nr:ATP-binding protein [Candidatus Daviesbacteria bacterium]
MGKLFILCGLSFSGKTYLAQKIAEHLPVTIISFDAIYEELRQKVGGDLSSQSEAWDQVKQIALSSLQKNLQEGKNVVWDSTNPLRKYREELVAIGDCFDAQSIVVYVNTPLDEIRKRRQENKATHRRSDRGSDDFEQKLRIWENPLEGERVIQITSESDILTFIHTLDTHEVTNEISLNTRRSKER